MIAVGMTLGVSMRCLSARWRDASFLRVLYVRQKLAHPEVITLHCVTDPQLHASP
jgi:hypothetical protein